jgi:hypothetical protein
MYRVVDPGDGHGFRVVGPLYGMKEATVCGPWPGLDPIHAVRKCWEWVDVNVGRGCAGDGVSVK